MWVESLGGGSTTIEEWDGHKEHKKHKNRKARL